MTVSEVEEVLGRFRHTLKDYTTYGGTLAEVNDPADVLKWLRDAGHSPKTIRKVLRSKRFQQ